MRVVFDRDHVLAAVLALLWGGVLLRPLCWWGLGLLRELAQHQPQQFVTHSYTSRVILVTLLFVLLPITGLVYGLDYRTLAAATFLVAVLVLAWIDSETGYLPDALTQPLLWLGLLVNVGEMYTTLEMAVLGAACAYGFLWLINAGFIWLRNKQGMGHGDFKLLAALTAWFGLATLPTLLLLSSLGALLYAALIWAIGRWYQGRYLHFGPYLAAAGVCQLFFQFSPYQ
ncbi:prepilin peptidase [Alcaligenes endophyticus]|uniref:A24 family peptidase n=1 Tax=Alcaligenes endophyticus TaxID=1929088 RepID=A0ABT8EIH2_9BURK|nr:A24 family peptidase [Alcaligenes endophyticus]MCX5592571.1 A24 family peptidase [Alcaligenes endophyticus]MDN4121081.1 A24 family peptidase [Alcaligenes endophyticus]